TSYIVFISLVITNISCLCRFFISAPNVFHEGVKEKVFVQLGKNHLNKNLRIYLEHESLGIVLSDTVTVTCTKEEKGELTELMVGHLSTLSPRPSYVMLVAEGLSVDRKMTRVLLSPHRGHIFIQTDQPLYNNTFTSTVKFRIFTLDHTFRPSEEVFHLLLYVKRQMFIPVVSHKYRIDLSRTVSHFKPGFPLNVAVSLNNDMGTAFKTMYVLSQGSIVDTNHVNMRDAITQTPLKLQISDNMVPSFRIIGYFYTPNNHIISDSVWLVAKGNCEEKVKVSKEHCIIIEPRRLSKLDIDLFGQEATVALLAVDTAFNSLNADNKLTQEQVYSSMEAYDLGCSYGGGQDPGSVMEEAGLAFFTTETKAKWRKGTSCHSKVRQKRSVDLEQEMMELKSKYEEEILQSCCAHGFLLIPMQWSCEERVKRVFELQGNTSCTWAFRDCCLEGQRLREQRAKEEAKKGLGRSDFRLGLPDSITTWEIRVVTLSKASGLCVKKPSLLRAFKPVFVSLRLPTSVRKYEEMFIAPVIYNYDSADLHVTVHMAQSEGLCSPGSATSVSFVNVTVSPDSSQTVTFSAVPMRSGSIPIQIRLYDINKESELDAIEKILNVWVMFCVFLSINSCNIFVCIFKGTNDVTRKINGKLPDDTVPESTSNIFISVEGMSLKHSCNLLNPEKVAKLIHLPSGCLEQTTRTLTQTAVAVRYLDLSDQWFSMPPGSRDEAVNYIGKVELYCILTLQTMLLFYRLTSHVVKVLSMGRKKINTPVQQIIEGVRYLSAKQEADGSFSDANRVLHRGILAAITVETTAYALLTAVALKEVQQANKLAHWLTTQENYYGGFYSSQVRKVFHLMEPKDICDKVSIEVKVKGKVKYTVAIQENYEYYDDDNMGDDNRMSRTAIEWIDIRTRRRRDVDSDQADDHFVTYEVCVIEMINEILTGMSIVDLTLLSGFVAEAEDLEAVTPPEQYISHYELSHGKVLIYLNQLVEQKQCFEFDAKQLHTVGLLQPAPAVFYDYYEPGHKCTVFYSAPKRSKVISRLCSGDVCQCAESLLNCVIQYQICPKYIQEPHCQLLSCSLAYMVTVMEASEKNNFVLYKTKVTDVLKINGDHVVKTGSHRVFAKRRQCKSRLEEGMEYLIMGKDGTTTDSHGKQYLLEANTWVEPKPFDCDKTDHANFCIDFTNFVEDFKANSCRQ
uniref:Uncharacterized protein n=1 Tax=Periophthalmus magnuspinnatus TaxID=409849 RepID=A0A3B3ZX95_9GOBI